MDENFVTICSQLFICSPREVLLHHDFIKTVQITWNSNVGGKWKRYKIDYKEVSLSLALFQFPPPLLNYKKRCSKIVHTAIFMLEMLWKFVQLFTLTRFNAVYKIKNYLKKLSCNEFQKKMKGGVNWKKALVLSIEMKNSQLKLICNYFYYVFKW